MINKEGIEFLALYRAYPKKYLPITDKQFQHYDEWEDDIVQNMCWSAGVLEENRPYFAEIWKAFGVTTVTVTVSLQETDSGSVVQMVLRSRLIECINPQKAKVSIKSTEEKDGYEFISVNIIMGTEDDNNGEQFAYWNGKTFKYDDLNDYNDKQTKLNKQRARMNIVSGVWMVVCIALIVALFLYAPTYKEKKAQRKAENEQWVKEYWETHPTLEPHQNYEYGEEDDDYNRDRALEEAYEGVGAYDNARGW